MPTRPQCPESPPPASIRLGKPRYYGVSLLSESPGRHEPTQSRLLSRRPPVQEHKDLRFSPVYFQGLDFRFPINIPLAPVFPINPYRLRL